MCKIQPYSLLKEINKTEFIEPLSEIIPNLIPHIGQNYSQFLHPYLYTGNNPINLIDPYGLYTWPYTWRGWAGVILGGAGGASFFVPLPGAMPLGYALITLGVFFAAWDTIEGFNAAERDARKIGQKILDRDKEEWEEIEGQLNINKRQCGKE